MREWLGVCRSGLWPRKRPLGQRKTWGLVVGVGLFAGIARSYMGERVGLFAGIAGSYVGRRVGVGYARAEAIADTACAK